MKKPLMILVALVLGVVVAGMLGTALTTTSSDDVGDSGAASLDASSGQAMPELATEMAPEMAADDATTARNATVEVREPSVIRTGSIGISTDRFDADLGRVRAVATALQGSVGSEQSHGSDGRTHAELVLRIPNASFDAAMARLGEIGEVTRRQVSTEDVTTQVIDTDARVRAQRASVTSLERLMDRARTVGEVMSVERELAQRQGELDSLLQQQRYLAGRTSMSTISVSVTDDPEETVEAGGGFVDGLHAGWSALGVFLTAAATFAGVLLPFVPVALFVGVPAWLVIRRRRRVAVAG